MYQVIDCYEGDEELLGTVETLKEARKLKNERIDDTDGECDVIIFNDKIKLEEEENE